MRRKSSSIRIKTKHKSIEGILTLNRDGRAFVEFSPTERDVEIHIKDLAGAMHGDKVKVELIPKHIRSGRQKGIVEQVIERKQSKFVGTVYQKKGKLFFSAEVSYPMPMFLVDRGLSIDVHEEELVVAEWLHWDDGQFPKVKIIEKCTHWNDTKRTYHKLLYEHGFSIGFSNTILKEAEKTTISEQDKSSKQREDFRPIFTMTIDPEDAKDFDDALSFRKLENGLYEIGVHIADVSHFVKPNSEIDKEAYFRTTSVYLPGYVEPMLPKKISNDICSLVPHEDRLCFAIIFNIDHEGTIKKHWITQTTICSNKRFNYDEVQDILSEKTSEYFPTLQVLNQIAQTWRKQRIAHGSIDFISSEKKIILSPTQEIVKIKLEETNESHQLIEEFMLMANQYVAKFLSKVSPKVKFPNRVHDLPNEDKLNEFVQFAKSKGYRLTHDVQLLPHALNKMIQTEKKKNARSPLPYLAIRCMAKAQYNTTSIGHYGLGFEDYAHFTSPIRRYPDLILHRILKAHLEKKNYMVSFPLEEACERCNEREKASMTIEREATKFKMIEYIQPHLGSVFHAMISGVSEKGMWAEIDDYFVEGFISIQELNLIDTFQYIPSLFCLKGKKTGLTFEIGAPIKVKMISASTEKRQITLQWIK